MKNIILVTGMPRSGTTFLGQCLNFSQNTNYLWEPFNPLFRKQISEPFLYLGKSSSQEKKDKLEHIINNTVNLKHLNVDEHIFPRWPIWKKCLKKIGISRTSLRYQTSIIKNKIFKPNNLIIKDPFAIFLSETLIKNFNSKIIISVKHPCAQYYSTIKAEKRGWRSKAEPFIKQSDLIKDQFSLNDLHKKLNSTDIVERRIHIMLLFYRYFLYLKNNFLDNCKIVNFNSLCSTPIEIITDLYKELELTMSEKIKKKIKKLTSGKQIDQKSSVNAKLESRNAKLLINDWKDHIDNETADKIMKTLNETYNELIAQ